MIFYTEIGFYKDIQCLLLQIDLNFLLTWKMVILAEGDGHKGKQWFHVLWHHIYFLCGGQKIRVSLLRAEPFPFGEFAVRKDFFSNKATIYLFIVHFGQFLASAYKTSQLNHSVSQAWVTHDFLRQIKGPYSGICDNLRRLGPFHSETSGGLMLQRI